MKYKILILSAVLLSGSSVFACAGFGLSKEELNNSISKMEKNIQGTISEKITGIVWNNLKITSGAEGDCSASSVKGDYQVATKKCIYHGTGEISIFGGVESSSYYSIGKPDCF